MIVYFEPHSAETFCEFIMVCLTTRFLLMAVYSISCIQFFCRCVMIIPSTILSGPHGYILEKIEGKRPKCVKSSPLNKWICRIKHNVFKPKVWHSWLFSVGFNFLCLFMPKNLCNIFDFSFSHSVLSLWDFLLKFEFHSGRICQMYMVHRPAPDKVSSIDIKGIRTVFVLYIFL